VNSHKVYLGLGSNLGDCRKNLERAIRLIGDRAGLVTRQSSFIETEPWGFESPNKFIFPPYDFQLADSMVANFYHSESTMLMETAAFGGYELVMEAYQKAVDNGYKFGCYGDCMLILDD
jgi:S-adenosylmethionine:tRNA-ribosyltransferase-isomerase (queuine synthetase)